MSEGSGAQGEGGSSDCGARRRKVTTKHGLSPGLLVMAWSRPLFLARLCTDDPRCGGL
ncbi:hypothetical protein L665_04120 [Ralstonia solanacearum SD54]|nr:hypothetical protein F504_2901 [Ralstonia pseudosolanacearum FQY_4]ANH31760.1 hypothetical protein A3768_0583 [Ralstonia solanacearum]ESS48926.1 hypothetical protein L665_04120 [Ralstonia solanacearum SD54]